MKHGIILAAILALALLSVSCSHKITSTHMNGWVASNTSVVSYNELTMNLDSEPIEYVIDISTASGKAKLKGLTLDQAKELILVEAIMHAKCATIFQPQYTQVMKNGKVLGIKLYGFPARYKNK